jgi:hypothetical protein
MRPKRKTFLLRHNLLEATRTSIVHAKEVGSQVHSPRADVNSVGCAVRHHPHLVYAKWWRRAQSVGFFYGVAQYRRRSPELSLEFRLLWKPAKALSRCPLRRPHPSSSWSGCSIFSKSDWRRFTNLFASLASHGVTPVHSRPDRLLPKNKPQMILPMNSSERIHINGWKRHYFLIEFAGRENFCLCLFRFRIVGLARHSYSSA